MHKKIIYLIKDQVNTRKEYNPIGNIATLNSYETIFKTGKDFGNYIKEQNQIFIDMSGYIEIYDKRTVNDCLIDLINKNIKRNRDNINIILYNNSKCLLQTKIDLELYVDNQLNQIKKSIINKDYDINEFIETSSDYIRYYSIIMDPVKMK